MRFLCRTNLAARYPRAFRRCYRRASAIGHCSHKLTAFQFDHGRFRGCLLLPRGSAWPGIAV